MVWWRPRPNGAAAPGRASTVATSPIAIVPRATLPSWRALASADRAEQGLTGAAERVATALRERGASFFVEIVQASGLLRVQVEEALGELVARGIVTADSFHGLRAVLTPQSRRRGFRGRGRLRGAAAFDAAGRWALLETAGAAPSDAGRAEALEHAAKALLRRYGVVCRALLGRETLAPSWRELLPFYRSAEARGEIRGGRFVEPFGGEQFALVEAVEELRRLRRTKGADEWLVLVRSRSAESLEPRRRLAARARSAEPSARVQERRGGRGRDRRRDRLARGARTPTEQRHVASLLAPDSPLPPLQRAKVGVAAERRARGEACVARIQPAAVSRT